MLTNFIHPVFCNHCFQFKEHVFNILNNTYFIYVTEFVYDNGGIN